MKLGRILEKSFWTYDRQKLKEALEYDVKFYLSWANRDKMDRHTWKTPEWRYQVCFRRSQAALGTVWYRLYYSRKLERLTRKTGIWIPAELPRQKGLIIGHWGRIIVNPGTIIGNDFFISSGVVIGRDIRGKRKGVPTIGNRVVVKTNVTIVGNVCIGDDVLIAPNAYVNFDVPCHSIVIGNPGKIIHRENATEGYLGEV